mgnify:FL=1
MNLKESILTLSRYQKKLDEEYAGLKAELEKIMFESPHIYKRISVPKSDRYYIYPCVQINNGIFEMAAKNINIDNLTITKKYSISCEEIISFDVTEVATLEPKEMDITIHGVKVKVKTHFFSKINYILRIENFEFKFTKRFFLNDVLKHYPEKINLKDFPCQLDNVTMRNQKIQINFTSSVMPFHFNTDTNISFSNIVKKYLESGKSTIELPLADNIICKIKFTSSKREQPFSIDLNCNRSSITLLGEFQVINYSARVLLNTLVDQRKILEFSGDGYGVVITNVPDEEIKIQELLNSN